MLNKKQKTKTIYNHILTGASLVVLAFLMIVISPAEVKAADSILDQEYTIIECTNNVREEAGLSSLTLDDRLMTSALNKANDMAKRGYFSHATPEGSRMSYWFHGAGYYYSLAGENLAKGFTSIDKLMKAWTDSPSHYRNLIESKFTNMGVGIAVRSVDGKQIIFVVQHFGMERELTKTKIAMIGNDASQITLIPNVSTLTAEPVFASPVITNRMNEQKTTSLLAELETEDISSDRDEPLNWLIALLAIVSLGIVGHTMDLINIDKMRNIIYAKKIFKPFHLN